MIKRYKPEIHITFSLTKKNEPFIEYTEDDNGDCVLYSDHLAKIKELEKEISVQAVFEASYRKVRSDLGQKNKQLQGVVDAAKNVCQSVLGVPMHRVTSIEASAIDKLNESLNSLQDKDNE